MTTATAELDFGSLPELFGQRAPLEAEFDSSVIMAIDDGSLDGRIAGLTIFAEGVTDTVNVSGSKELVKAGKLRARIGKWGVATGISAGSIFGFGSNVSADEICGYGSSYVVDNPEHPEYGGTCVEDETTPTTSDTQPPVVVTTPTTSDTQPPVVATTPTTPSSQQPPVVEVPLEPTPSVEATVYVAPPHEVTEPDVKLEPVVASTEAETIPETIPGTELEQPVDATDADGTALIAPAEGGGTAGSVNNSLIEDIKKPALGLGVVGVFIGGIMLAMRVPRRNSTRRHA